MSAALPVAIGYVRVSTTDQTRGYSLDQVIRAWAERRHLTLETIYGNDSHGESGKDLERTALKAALARIGLGGVGWLVVAKVDRLSRDFGDSTGLFQLLEDQGVELVAPGDGIDQAQGGRRLMALIHAYIADQERHRILARIRPGLAQRVANDLPLGRPPLGYRFVGERKDQRLEIDPATAPLVNALFHQAAETGWGDARLARWASNRAPPAGQTTRQLAHPRSGISSPTPSTSGCCG